MTTRYFSFPKAVYTNSELQTRIFQVTARIKHFCFELQNENNFLLEIQEIEKLIIPEYQLSSRDLNKVCFKINEFFERIQKTNINDIASCLRFILKISNIGPLLLLKSNDSLSGLNNDFNKNKKAQSSTLHKLFKYKKTEFKLIFEICQKILNIKNISHEILKLAALNLIVFNQESHLSCDLYFEDILYVQFLFSTSIDNQIAVFKKLVKLVSENEGDHKIKLDRIGLKNINKYDFLAEKLIQFNDKKLIYLTLTSQTNCYLLNNLVLKHFDFSGFSGKELLEILIKAQTKVNNNVFKHSFVNTSTSTVNFFDSNEITVESGVDSPIVDETANFSLDGVNNNIRPDTLNNKPDISNVVATNNIEKTSTILTLNTYKNRYTLTSDNTITVAPCDEKLSSEKPNNKSPHHLHIKTFLEYLIETNKKIDLIIQLFILKTGNTKVSPLIFSRSQAITEDFILCCLMSKQYLKYLNVTNCVNIFHSKFFYKFAADYENFCIILEKSNLLAVWKNSSDLNEKHNATYIIRIAVKNLSKNNEIKLKQILFLLKQQPKTLIYLKTEILNSFRYKPVCKNMSVIKEIILIIKNNDFVELLIPLIFNNEFGNQRELIDFLFSFEEVYISKFVFSSVKFINKNFKELIDKKYYLDKLNAFKLKNETLNYWNFGCFRNISLLNKHILQTSELVNSTEIVEYNEGVQYKNNSLIFLNSSLSFAINSSSFSCYFEIFQYDNSNEQEILRISSKKESFVLFVFDKKFKYRITNERGSETIFLSEYLMNDGIKIESKYKNKKMTLTLGNVKIVENLDKVTELKIGRTFRGIVTNILIFESIFQRNINFYENFYVDVIEKIEKKLRYNFKSGVFMGFKGSIVQLGNLPMRVESDNVLIS
ncbi:hypothetical protein CDIK_1592 [Cucumispora dikerogammari]|nr:hypothetical protein CDIK_1592 [Cucumispora dikerogammari]